MYHLYKPRNTNKQGKRKTQVTFLNILTMFHSNIATTCLTYESESITGFSADNTSDLSCFHHRLYIHSETERSHTKSCKDRHSIIGAIREMNIATIFIFNRSKVVLFTRISHDHKRTTTNKTEKSPDILPDISNS